MPYELEFVAGNTAGCGTPYTSGEAFFTKEGGNIHLPLQLLLCDYSSCPPVPDKSPYDIVVMRLSDTAMNVSFRELSIVEAKSVHVEYYISYSARSSRKRQAPGSDVRVPDGGTSKVIDRLDAKSEYDVIMYASTSKGEGPKSSPVIASTYPGLFIASTLS